VRVTYRRRSGFQARKMRFWDDKRVPGKNNCSFISFHHSTTDKITGKKFKILESWKYLEDMKSLQ
jgi:hypothetical protein